MEKKEALEITLENILIMSKDIIKRYCISNEIENEKEIHPANWSDILDEINAALIPKGSTLLKTKSNLYNQYDIDKVIYLYERVYKKLCNIYIQEINQKDFLTFSGIDKQSLYNWSGDNKSSSQSFDFIEKMNEDNEQSVWSLMRGDNGNPNKYFGKLNKYHGWNGSGTTSDASRNKPPLTVDKLPKLSGNTQEFVQIEQKEDL